MFETEDREYYRRRAHEERVAAASATNPGVRDIHLELADRYTQLVGDPVVPRPPIPVR